MSPQELALAGQQGPFWDVTAPCQQHAGPCQLRSSFLAPSSLPKEGHGPSGAMGTMVGSRSHLVPVAPPGGSVPRRKRAVGGFSVETGTVGRTGEAVGKIRHGRAQC